jgi:hypothetical protein
VTEVVVVAEHDNKKEIGMRTEREVHCEGEPELDALFE